MRLFYDTMPTPEMMEFHVEIQGRRIMKTIHLQTHKKNVPHIIRLLKNRLSVEGDRLSDVKGLTLYSKQEKSTVQRALNLPYDDDEAKEVLEGLLYAMREAAVTGGFPNGY